MINFRWQDDRQWVVQQEDLGEAGAEASSIDIDLTSFGKVDLLASWTEVLEARGAKGVAEANGENFLAITKCSRTCSIGAIEEFLVDFRESLGIENEAGVDHSVQVRRLLVELEESFVVKIVFVWLLWRQDHPEASLELIFGKFLLEALQVERISNVIFVDLNQEFVSFKRAEPLDPSDLVVCNVRVI